MPENSQYVGVTATGAGTCHVEFTFAKGATSSVDLDFTSHQLANGCGENFTVVTKDGGNPNIEISVPAPDCDAGLDGEASD